MKASKAPKYIFERAEKMKKQLQPEKPVKRPVLFLVLAAAATFVTAFSIAGCQQAEQAGSKKSRLIAAENIELKKKLNSCNDTLALKKKQLEECILERDEYKGLSDEKTGELLESIMEPFAGEIKKLEKENKALKSEIRALKSQVEQNKQDPNYRSG